MGKEKESGGDDWGLCLELFVFGQRCLLKYQYMHDMLFFSPFRAAQHGNILFHPRVDTKLVDTVCKLSRCASWRKGREEEFCSGIISHAQRICTGVGTQMKCFSGDSCDLSLDDHHRIGGFVGTLENLRALVYIARCAAFF